MTPVRAALFVLFAASSLLACGPHSGGSCSKSGYFCQDPATALECRGGQWLTLPCRGAGGCAQSGNTVSCDMSANQPGDACASAEEGHGLCSGAGTAVYQCRDGKLVQTKTCGSCTAGADQVVCNP